MTMTPQPNRYASVKQQAASTTVKGFGETDTEESKVAGTPGAVSKELKDILEDLQNNCLQIYALWSEDGDVHRSFIQQPLRPNSLNTISLAQGGGRLINGYNTYGLPAMITHSSMHLNPGMLNRKKHQLKKDSL